MAQIDRQSMRLTNLVNQLLDLSRIKAGKLVLDRQEMDVVEVAGEALTVLRRAHPRRQFLLEAEAPLTASVCWTGRDAANGSTAGLLPA